MKSYKCPNCSEVAYALTSELTVSRCDKCGFEFDFEKVPFMKGLVNIMKEIKKGITIPIDLEDEVDG
jgi:DNA-directed RNA polymerase subunit RPC12/RpoP